MKRIMLWIGMAIMTSSFSPTTLAAKDSHKIHTATAIFAGGCFWCLQADFDHVPGVVKTLAGYAGGEIANPTYEQVSAGGTGHYESVEVTYDPVKINYAQLLQVFWHHIDPVDPLGQFCDKGQQYRAVIFYQNADQLAQAEASKVVLVKEKKFGATQITTQILPAKTFYPAEEYHQQYYLKNPLRYKFYRYTCGRDQRLAKVWSGE